MRKKQSSIPTNPMAEQFATGIFIGRTVVAEANNFDEATLTNYEKAKQSHRDDYHLFFFQEAGSAFIEIDFQKYKIKPNSIVYIHPDQVHRILSFSNVTVGFLAVNSDNINADQLRFLDDISPIKPLLLNKSTFKLLSEVMTLTIEISERKTEILHSTLLKDSCNLLVSLIASQYLAESQPINILPRFEIVTKAFKAILEKNFITAKRPSEYAQKLNISTPYLNECVKKTTGHSVSEIIHQRIILEAKRFLYHTDKSVKEISTELGYEDYPYFCRLFTKTAGLTALEFRKKNSD